VAGGYLRLAALSCPLPHNRSAVDDNLCCVVKAIFTAGLAPRFWLNVSLALVQP
jgi:hypothetical protein